MMKITPRDVSLVDKYNHEIIAYRDVLREELGTNFEVNVSAIRPHFIYLLEVEFTDILENEKKIERILTDLGLKIIQFDRYEIVAPPAIY